MIGYFQKQYGPDILGDNFSKEILLYDSFIENKILSINYGKYLNLILIEYHLSSRDNKMPFEFALNSKKVSNYSSKDKSISVIIPVVLKDFFELSEFERKKKFTDDAIYAVNLVREKLEKKKLDINFDKLLADLQKCNEEFLVLN